MRIGILAGCLGRRDGGPETYERELIKAIAQIDRTNEYRIYTFEDAAAECLGPLPGNFVVRSLRPRNRWISLGVSLPFRIMHDSLDVLHAALYPPPLCPVPLVFTMHDISPIARPDFFSPSVYRRLNPLVRGGLKRARVVVCVSEDAMNTTAELTGLDRGKMRVVPHGVNPMFRPADPDAARTEIAAKYGLTTPYLLFVGKIMARKNVARLIEAYARFIDATDAETPLVLAGKRLYGNDDVDAAIVRHSLADRVKEIGYVPDELLPSLYGGALAVAYVTLWEGFGLPILEAMASGAPVIASNVSSIPEIAGDAAMLVDPLDTDAIADAIRQVYQSPDLRAGLSARGLRRAAQFSWARTASATIHAYRQAATPRPAPETIDGRRLV